MAASTRDAISRKGDIVLGWMEKFGRVRWRGEVTEVGEVLAEF